MVVEEWLVGLAQDRVAPVQDLDQVGLEQEDLDQVEQEDLDQVELEAMELVQVELVPVDSDQEALVKVLALMLGDLHSVLDETFRIRGSSLLGTNGSVGSLCSVNIFHRVDLKQQDKEYIPLFPHYIKDISHCSGGTRPCENIDTHALKHTGRHTHTYTQRKG